MATKRQEFERVAGLNPVPPVAEFPKLPDAIRNRLTEEGRKELDIYEEQVQEFFKQQARRSF